MMLVVTRDKAKWLVEEEGLVEDLLVGAEEIRLDHWEATTLIQVRVGSCT
jgi:hypothetical protein